MADCTTVRYDRVTTSLRVLRRQYTYQKNMKLLFRWMNEKKTFHVYLKDADIGSVAFIEYLLLLQPFWFLKNHQKKHYNPSTNEKYNSIPIYSWEYKGHHHFVGRPTKHKIKNTKQIKIDDKILFYGQYSFLLNYAKTELYQNIIFSIIDRLVIDDQRHDYSFYLRFDKNGTNGSNMIGSQQVKCVKIGRFSTLESIKNTNDNILKKTTKSNRNFLDHAFEALDSLKQKKKK